VGGWAKVREGLADLQSFTGLAWRHRGLVNELVSRDLKGGHAGHSLGWLWVFAQPLIVVITYMLIFGVVIGARVAQTETFPGDYISYVLIGLVPWLMTQGALARGPSVFLSNANLVKQVVFPIEVLPIANVLACLYLFLPAFAVLLAYKLLFGGGLGWWTLSLPIILAVHTAFLLGLMLLLSVLTPFVRDLREVVGIYSTVSMYFTPAIYLPDWVPAQLRPMLYLNPFSYVAWVYQDALFFERLAHPWAWVVFAVMTIVALVGGLSVFRKVRPYLGNVL
jgi:lipopolysaccharide transport system permease protein